MKSNHLPSFLPVTFFFALPLALLHFILLPHFFPTTIHRVEIIYLSLFFWDFFASATVKLHLSLLSLLLSSLSPLLSLYMITSLTSLLLSCALLPALLLHACGSAARCVHSRPFCLLKAGAQDPMEELTFSKDPLPKSQFPSQYQNGNEVPAIFSSSLHQKVLCQETLSLDITRRGISAHVPPVSAELCLF